MEVGCNPAGAVLGVIGVSAPLTPMVYCDKLDSPRFVA
jgi:hypothetical protein